MTHLLDHYWCARECNRTQIHTRRDFTLGARLSSRSRDYHRDVRMSRKKVWNSIMRRKKKNHLDLSPKDDSPTSSNVCKSRKIV